MAAPALARQEVPAQPPGPLPESSRPYRGLFGAGSPAAPGRSAFDLTAAVYEEYGNLPEGDVPLALPALGAGWFTGARAAVSMEHAGRHTGFGLRGEASLRYYHDLGQTTPVRARVDAGFDAALGKRHDSRLRLSGAYQLEPYYLLPFFDAPAPVIGGTTILPIYRDDALYARRRHITSGAIGYEMAFTPRDSLVFDASLRDTRADGVALDVQDYHASGRFSRRVTRDLSLRAGYTFQRGRYGIAAQDLLTTQGLDLSVDYRRTLPFSRKTTVGFGSGSALVDGQEEDRRYFVTGYATLRHDMGRGWFIGADYSRAVQLVEGFAAPFLANTVTASLGGFASPRVELYTSGGYSAGDAGFGGGRYEVTQASARLRVALAKYAAVSTEGLLYAHRFPDGAAAPGVFPGRLDRWAVRAGLTLWLPLAR
jgi:hypothetical protein